MGFRPEYMAIVALVLAGIIVLAISLVWLLLWISGKALRFKIPYAPFGWTSLGLIITIWGLMAYGIYVGRWKLNTTTVDYSHKDIPAAFDGYRIVHISDLHLSTFADRPEKLRLFIDRINGLNPDLVCFTGDLVSIGPEEAEPFTETLKRIKAEDGVISVLGNHDLMIYSMSKGRNGRSEQERLPLVKQLVSYEADSLGWKVLRNSNMEIRRGDGSICILGVDNTNGHDQGFSTISAGDLGKAMEGSSGFRILLSHDPSHWSSEVLPQTDIPLTLSGHTHAAQIRIFGWTPASWVFRQTDGRYDSGDQTLYVNIGLGCTAPARIGANPEITLIRLSPKRS